MPTFDWNQLVTHDQWAQKLNELLTGANSALTQSDAAKRQVAIKAAIAALKEYIDHEPGFINDLLEITKSAIIDVALADIGDALSQISDLQKHLQDIISGNFKLIQFTQPTLLPRRRLLQAFSSLTSLRKQHEEQPFTHATLGEGDIHKQLDQTLSLMAELFDPKGMTYSKAEQVMNKSSKRKLSKPADEGK